MAEAIKVTLVSSGPYDGVTPITLTRNDLGSAPRYTANINGGGVIDSTIFGLLPENSSKLVSIAAESEFPGIAARVTSTSNPDNGPEHVCLGPRYQSVFVGPGEVIRIHWVGDNDAGTARTRKVHLVVQDLSERECTPMMRVEHRPEPRMVRYHLALENGQSFSAADNPFQPVWIWDESRGIRRATLPSGAGYLTLGDLVENHNGLGVYARVKFSGTQPGAVATMHWLTSAVYQIETIVAERWSNAIWLAFNDRLAFNALVPALGGQAMVEIEVCSPRMRALAQGL